MSRTPLEIEALAIARAQSRTTRKPISIRIGREFFEFVNGEMKIYKDVGTLDAVSAGEIGRRPMMRDDNKDGAT